MTDAVYYRYEDHLQSSGGVDMWGEWEPGPSVLRVQVVTFDILKKTPKGAWINGPEGAQLVLDHWYRKFANPTLEGARLDFIARKRYLIAFQERRIRDARIAIETATRNVFDAGAPIDGLPRKLKRVYTWEVELCR